MLAYSKSVHRLIEEFGKLPGIGNKTAERLAHYILRAAPEEAMGLADAIREVKQNVRHCSACYNLAEGELCEICSDPRRDQSIVCVVEQPRDLMALERTASYRGVYHVLLGRVAPLEGIGPEQLTIDALVDRVRRGNVREVIMATNPTLEGDGTALYISNLLAGLPVEVTRLARGIPTGSVLEFANAEMLSDAIDGRQKF
ncbi:MAG: recombination mediator RecR [Pirellulales bacterium]